MFLTWILCVCSSSQGLDPDPSYFNGVLWSFHCDSVEGKVDGLTKKIPCSSQEELQRHFNLNTFPLGLLSNWDIHSGYWISYWPEGIWYSPKTFISTSLSAVKFMGFKLSD